MRIKCGQKSLLETKYFDCSMKYKIKIPAFNKILSAQKGDYLAHKIQDAGINLSAYCGKRGICGKCLVEIVEGKLPSPIEREKFLFAEKKFKSNFRLACLYRICSDLKIRIPDESLLPKTFILKTGIKSPIILDPAVKKYHLYLKKPKMASPESLLDRLEGNFNKRLVISLNLLVKLQKILEKGKSDITATLWNDNEILDVNPGKTIKKNYGLAADLGTTTVSVALVDLNTGEEIGALTALNSQVKYGPDIISRISYALKDPKKLNALNNSIRTTLNQMTQHLLEKSKIDSSCIYEVVVAGNTVMSHFFLGIPVHSLAVAPFYSAFTSLPELSAKNVRIKINKSGKVYIVPNIKSFVGGDVTAGLIASELENKKGNYLYIDLGTNGEVVLKAGEKLVATSTAAGPAFEGMNITCGMLALPGAIDQAEYNDKLNFTTIDGKRPQGICGTGLIDLIAVFLGKGEISPKGTINNPTKRIPITDDIFIFQKDVRQMQLAVAALKTGISIMLHRNHLKANDLDGIFISGAFGNYLNTENTMKIGLIPQMDTRKIIFIGNASLAGAKALLLSKALRDRAESIIKKIKYVSLATDPEFQKTFIEAMTFGSERHP